MLETMQEGKGPHVRMPKPKHLKKLSGGPTTESKRGALAQEERNKDVTLAGSKSLRGRRSEESTTTKIHCV